MPKEGPGLRGSMDRNLYGPDALGLPRKGGDWTKETWPKSQGYGGYEGYDGYDGYDGYEGYEGYEGYGVYDNYEGYDNYADW